MPDTLLNFEPKDPFKNGSETFNEAESAIIHLRIQQRNGKKCITIVQGLGDDKVKEYCPLIRKRFNCNGAIVTDKEVDIPVIQFSGDQRRNIFDFLVERGYVRTNIKIHGY